MEEYPAWPIVCAATVGKQGVDSDDLRGSEGAAESWEGGPKRSVIKDAYVDVLKKIVINGTCSVPCCLVSVWV